MIVAGLFGSLPVTVATLVRVPVVEIVIVPDTAQIPEHAAKAGVLGLAKNMARELGPEARVNGVAPGTIVWPEGDEWGDELSRQRIINQSALKRIGDPDDIAKAVDYLVSAAPYVTGQVIAVDGGRSIAL